MKYWQSRSMTITITYVLTLYSRTVNLVCNGPPRCYTTCNETVRDIFEYFEVFYNGNRRHSTIGYDSQAEVEARTAIA